MSVQPEFSLALDTYLFCSKLAVLRRIIFFSLLWVAVTVDIRAVLEMLWK